MDTGTGQWTGPRGGRGGDRTGAGGAMSALGGSEVVVVGGGHLL